MTAVCEERVESDTGPIPPYPGGMGPSTARFAALDALAAPPRRIRAQVRTRVVVNRTILRCGSCHATIERVGPDEIMRCGRCRRSLVVPAHIRLRCDRCHHTHRVSPRSLNVEHMCPQCGKELAGGYVLLEPRRRRRRRHRTRHDGVHTGYASGAGTVLVIGLVLALMVFMLLMA